MRNHHLPISRKRLRDVREHLNINALPPRRKLQLPQRSFQIALRVYFLKRPRSAASLEAKGVDAFLKSTRGGLFDAETNV